MAQSVGPNFAAKAVLTTGRVLHQPFEVPTEMTKSALLQSGVTHAALGSINAAALEAVDKLQPRGPAKLLTSLMGRIDNSIASSTEQAKKATEIFWVPFSNGSHQVGHAVSNPFAMFYANRAGFEVPAEPDAAQALLAGITDPNPDSTKFPGLAWPTPPPKADPGSETPPQDGETPVPADPAKDGETPAPTDPGKDGETPAPTDPGDGGETPAPTDPGDGGETPAPTDPSDGGETPAPTDPSDGGETPAPTDPGKDGETPAPATQATGEGAVETTTVSTDGDPAAQVRTVAPEPGTVEAQTAGPVIDPAAFDAAAAQQSTASPEAG